LDHEGREGLRTTANPTMRVRGSRSRGSCHFAPFVVQTFAPFAPFAV